MSKRITINDVKDLCNLKNIKLLTDEYVNSKTKLKLECPNKHIYYASYSTIRANHKCPYCFGSKKYTLEQVKTLCKNKNFLVNDDNYVSNGTKMHFTCLKCNYKFSTTLNSILRNSGCANCTKTRSLTLDEVKSICLEKYLILNSTEYKNKNSILSVTCKKCNKKNITILDNIYINSHSKLNVSCNICNYKFKSAFNTLQYHGCPNCSKCAKPTIDKFKNIAKSKNAICISENYINSKTKLEFLCLKCNKNFKLTPDDVNRGRWCSNCSTSTSEKICKLAMETIIGCEFKRVRPKWLLNPKTNYPLELDGYNESLNIAFEHNGKQHFQEVEKFRMTKEDLMLCKERDKIKKELCEKHNVKLIVIPALFFILKLKDLEGYILSECKKLNIEISDYSIIDYSKAYF